MQLEKQPGSEYKKMVLMVPGSAPMFELKRKIEREFAELYPQEPPFVVSKLLDSQQYALSGNSRVSDVLMPGDYLTAHPLDQAQKLSGGSNPKEHLLLLQSMQRQVLEKLAVSESLSGSLNDTMNILKMVTPLGLQSSDMSAVRNVALILTKTLTYDLCQDELFREDTDDVQVTQDALTLLEVLMLTFEHWATSFLNRDAYLMGLTIGLLEVLVHSVAFWQRLKQSTVLSRLLMQIQDFESEGEIKRKATKCLTALGKDKHSDVPAPLDFNRYRREP